MKEGVLCKKKNPRKTINSSVKGWFIILFIKWFVHSTTIKIGYVNIHECRSTKYILGWRLGGYNCIKHTNLGIQKHFSL